MWFESLPPSRLGPRDPPPAARGPGAAPRHRSRRAVHAAPPAGLFRGPCKAIFTQQISTAVAAILFARFRDLFPLRRPTPQLVFDALCNVEADVPRKCGLSRQKAAYLRDLSRHFLDGRVPTRRLGRMSDEEVIESLVAVKGIGRWTAEMFLIFTLNRPDVLPADDLGLREGVREVYGLSERPGAKALKEIGEPWRPYRSIATWYLWRRSPAPAPGADDKK